LRRKEVEAEEGHQCRKRRGRKENKELLSGFVAVFPIFLLPKHESSSQHIHHFEAAELRKRALAVEARFVAVGVAIGAAVSVSISSSTSTSSSSVDGDGRETAVDAFHHLCHGSAAAAASSRWGGGCLGELDLSA
jgi:hypothetical protein